MLIEHPAGTIKNRTCLLSASKFGLLKLYVHSRRLLSPGFRRIVTPQETLSWLLVPVLLPSTVHSFCRGNLARKNKP